MCRVAVLATGGSTATRTDRSRTAVARASEQELLGDLPLAPGIAVDAEDVFYVGSHATTLEHLQGAAVRVDEHLRDDVVDIVITHGTDTTEETAIFPDLVLADRRLIVLTGAQRPADTPGSDGPRDLADAITVVAHSATRGPVALIVFDGAVLPARGTAESQTLGRTDDRRMWSEHGHGLVDADPGLRPCAVGGNGLRQRGASRRRLPGRRHCHSRVIRSTSRQGVVLDTATALWTTLLSRSEVPVDPLLGLPARLHRPPSCRAVS